MLEEGTAKQVTIDGQPRDPISLEQSPALEADSLALVRVSGDPPRWTRAIRLPARTPQIVRGMGIMLQSRCGLEFHERRGTIRALNGSGVGLAFMSDVPIAQGESGSPILRNGALVGICQGRLPEDDRAVAIPISPAALGELRRLRKRKRRPLYMAALVAVLVGLCAFGHLMWSRFSIAAVEPSDNRMALTVANAERPSLRSSWVASFNTPIATYGTFSGEAGGGGAQDHVVVGTSWQADHNGQVSVFSESGRKLWSYAIPRGECIYGHERESFDGFDVAAVAVHDVDDDGTNELVVTFTHHYSFASKLMVFSLAGRVLAEYWHPGPITNVAAGHVGTGRPSMVVASARNVSLAAYVPGEPTAECIFAFAWDRISGQGPVYIGTGPVGTELWYRIVADVGLQTRATIQGVSLEDIDRDADNEIRVSLSDGRFYFLNETGNVVGVATNETWLEAYGTLPAPSLMSLTLRGG